MPELPLISVIMPLYNHREYVGEALDSLLAQDYPRLEILVVDDGSSDGGPEWIAAEYAARGVRLLQQRRNGCGTTRALNTALAASQGDFICWLSADDWFLPGKLSAQYAAYRARFGTGLGVLHAQPGYASSVRDHALAQARLPEAEIRAQLESHGQVRWSEPAQNLPPDQALFYFFLFNYVNGITVFLPRELFERYGDFDEAFPLTQDYEFWFRLAWHGVPFHLMPVCLSYSRMHSGNLGLYRSDIPAEKNLIPRCYGRLVSPDALARARQVQGFSADQHALFMARIMQSLGLEDQLLFWLERQALAQLPEAWGPILQELATRFAPLAEPLPLPLVPQCRFLLMLSEVTLPTWRWHMCLTHYFAAFDEADAVELRIWLPEASSAVRTAVSQRLGAIAAYLERPLTAAYQLVEGDMPEVLAEVQHVIPVGSPDQREAGLLYLARRHGREIHYRAQPEPLREAVGRTRRAARSRDLPIGQLLIWARIEQPEGWQDALADFLDLCRELGLAGLPLPASLLLIPLDDRGQELAVALEPWLPSLEATGVELTLLEEAATLAEIWPQAGHGGALGKRAGAPAGLADWAIADYRPGLPLWAWWLEALAAPALPPPL